MKIAVLGLGAWGETLAGLAQGNGHQLVVWARGGDAKGFEALQSPADAASCDLVIIATAVAGVPSMLGQLLPGQAGPQASPPVLLCSKGVSEDHLRTPFEEAMRLKMRAAILAGPNFAGEIQAGLPAASIIAGHEEALCRFIINALKTNRLRLYASSDPVGASLCSAFKNVIAIAASIVEGAGLGWNARATLITRALAELTRLIMAEGGKTRTIAGLAGVGDVLLTATSQQSRNYQFGLALGAGAKPADAMASIGACVEGALSAAPLLVRASKLGIDMPICQTVSQIIEGQIKVEQAITDLLARPLPDHE